MDNTSYVLLALLLNAPNLSAHTISTDYCDPKSYTDEVRNLTCDNKGIRFRADGLPHPDHPLMTGITATNQQFPVKHNYEFSITNSPKVSAIKTTPDSGPIGVAVNGIPIFDPATQGPVNPITGKRPSTLDAGELDTCGGHAGRGMTITITSPPVASSSNLAPTRSRWRRNRLDLPWMVTPFMHWGGSTPPIPSKHNWIPVVA